MSGEAAGPTALAHLADGTGVAIKAAPKKRQESKAEIPVDWQPGADHVALAVELGLDLTREAAKFRDHAAGTGRRQARWGAAFSLWLRRSSEFGSAPRGQVRQGHFKVTGNEVYQDGEVEI